MKIRRATAADAGGIREIYNQAVLETTVTMDLVPRSLEDQQAWIADRQGSLGALVAEAADGSIVGFASLSRYKERPAYKTTVENSIYVAPSAHRTGVGSELLGALIELAKDHGYHSIVARIAEGQEASVGLHSKFGFKLVGVEQQVGRKFGRWIDVTVMQLLTQES